VHLRRPDAGGQEEPVYDLAAEPLFTYAAPFEETQV
jgi:hypothetical protein